MTRSQFVILCALLGGMTGILFNVTLYLNRAHIDAVENHIVLERQLANQLQLSEYMMRNKQ